MDNSEIFIQNEPSNNKKSRLPIIIIASIVFVLIVVVLAVVILRIIDDKEKVYLVDDSNQLSEVPGQTRDSIERKLCLSLKDSFGLSDCAGVVGDVRADSLGYYYDDSGLLSVEFLLDVDSLERTYAIESWWSDFVEVPDDVSINCPKKEDSKYPGQECLANDTVYGPLDSYLPATLELDSGEEVTVLYSYYNDDGDTVLRIDVNNCGKQSIIDSAKKAVEEWLVSNEFNPDDYIYDIPLKYDKCMIGRI